MVDKAGGHKWLQQIGKMLYLFIYLFIYFSSSSLIHSMSKVGEKDTSRA
jgi:hypothetical protein